MNGGPVKPTCSECGARPVVSYAQTKCDVCLYRAEMGEEATARQTALAAALAEKRKAKGKAAKL